MRRRRLFHLRFKTIAVCVLSWVLLAYFIFYLSPNTVTIAACTIFIFLAVLTSLAIVFGYHHRVLLFTIGIVLLLLLKVFQLIDVITVTLLCAALFSLDIFLRTK